MLDRPKRRRTRRGLAFLAGAVVLAAASTAAAGNAVEAGDAGSLPATAQSPAFGPVTSPDSGSVAGTLSNVNDVDVYRLCLTGAKTFSASMVGTPGTLHDPQLWLFDAQGRGVYANDDVPGTRRARLPANHPLTPSAAGVYYLALSSFVNFPFSAGGSMFPFSPSTVNGPLSPGGNLPVAGWTNAGRTSGTYTIELTGVDQSDTDADGIADGCEPDTTPPVLEVPADVTVDATGPGGAVVSFAATATDDVDPSPSVVCSPASGSVFPIGTTTVTCTATDDAGNSAEATFVVLVLGADDQLDSLQETILAYDLAPDGFANSLLVKLQAALDALAADDTATACTKLQDFLNQVAAQRGKKLTEAQADELTDAATRIRAVLACG